MGGFSEVSRSDVLKFHHSILPLFHVSITPNFPPFQSSTLPAFPCSISYETLATYYECYTQ